MQNQKYFSEWKFYLVNLLIIVVKLFKMLGSSHFRHSWSIFLLEFMTAGRLAYVNQFIDRDFFDTPTG